MPWWTGAEPGRGARPTSASCGARSSRWCSSEKAPPTRAAWPGSRRSWRAARPASRSAQCWRRSPEARLVTASDLDGEPTYELAHEALIGSWDRLRDWLGQRPNKAEAEAIRGELRLRRRLQYAAEAWRVDRGALMRPPELALVQELRTRQPEELSARNHEFIDASVHAWEAHDRWRRRVRALGIGASIAFVGMVSILGLLAWQQSVEARREKAEAQRQKTEAQHNAKTAQERLAASDLEQGRSLLFDGHPMRALPYFLDARQEGFESPVLRMLYARASAAAPQLTVEHRQPVIAAAFSPDGTRMVTASWDHTARVWDARTGKPVTEPLEHRDRITAAAFSPDGDRVVTASWDHTARVCDARTGKPVTGPLEHRDWVPASTTPRGSGTHAPASP
ncbi:MAG: hypothetical protein E6J90_23740 [Deltaproteobacteria bacterium]|nr:MAG: hypothetical protein E6J90_23740 [Deltaproteobacteria bacterium]